MPSYRYTGPYPALYPNVKGPDGRSLSVSPGDVIQADNPPNDGNWVPVVQGEVISEMDQPDIPAKPRAIAKRSA